MNPPNDMDLRDWFAGQALMAILMSPNTPRAGESPLDVHAANVAEEAYAYADAMLVQRGRQGG